MLFVQEESISTAGMNWNEATALPIRYMEREDVADVNRPVPAVGNGLLPNMKLIDPRPVAKWAKSPYTADDDGFSSPVSYYGAFAPEGPTWLDEWTAMSQLGMITNVTLQLPAASFLMKLGSQLASKLKSVQLIHCRSPPTAVLHGQPLLARLLLLLTKST